MKKLKNIATEIAEAIKRLQDVGLVEDAQQPIVEPAVEEPSAGSSKRPPCATRGKMPGYFRKIAGASHSSDAAQSRRSLRVSIDVFP